MMDKMKTVVAKLKKDNNQFTSYILSIQCIHDEKVSTLDVESSNYTRKKKKYYKKNMKKQY